MSALRSARVARAVVVLAWVLAAVLAGAMVWWAVAQIGAEPDAPRDGVLTQSQVAALAAQAASPSPVRAPNPSPAAPATAAEVARVWDVTGGKVGAACRGAQIGLLYATPQDGWTVEVTGSGPEQVEVKFGRQGATTTVRAVCRDEVPEHHVGAGEQ